MPSTPKKNTKNAKTSNKAIEDGDSLKMDLDEIIKKTDEQNKALGKIMKENY